MEEIIKNKLLEFGFINRHFYDNLVSLRIDEMGKNNLKELYKLRLEISIENNNLNGISLCQDFLKNLSKCSGKKVFSILLKTKNESKSFFINEKLTEIW